MKTLWRGAPTRRLVGALSGELVGELSISDR
jgi:hypothetical protein